MWYRFEVKERFTGLRPDEKEVTVWLSLGGGSPQIGRSFFVHAERRGNQIRLAECGNTQPVEDASADIQYLRASLQNAFTPYIAGSVLRHYQGSQYAVETDLDGPPQGLARSTVKLESEKQSFEVITDEAGQFRKDGVLPGRYTLTPLSPGYVAKQPYNVEVPSRGCGIAHVGMFTNSKISGVVIRADGKPAENVRLDLIDADPQYRSITSIMDMIETGPSGQFSIDHLPSGRFLLGVNIEESSRYPDRTPPTFYPGVADRSTARAIELAPNEIKTGLVLKLMPPREFRRVRVHVRWPDGRVPTRGSIDAWANKGIYVSSKDLKDGIFELQLLQGVDYWLTAAALDEARPISRFISGTWVYADNYRLAGGIDPIDVVVTAHFAEPQWADAVYGHSPGNR
jgi:hypothetical protein